MVDKDEVPGNRLAVAKSGPNAKPQGFLQQDMKAPTGQTGQTNVAMSDRDDVVLHVLCADLMRYAWKGEENHMLEKAIAIQKAQARVIEAADIYAVERNKGMSAPTKLGKLNEALAALDEVKK